MPRFVVLHHQCPPGYPRASHWDFMLEADGTLRTWALAARPDTDSPIDAEALADHRLAYLELAGPLSGGRGSVSRYDRGEYRAEQWRPEMVVVRLSGARLSGRATLLTDGSDAQRWRFWFLPDASVSAGGDVGDTGGSSA
ncbi:MAG TPA: DNA polymerase ligase N-terminal domain-containing protein [Pirellulales bacterium]|nr:DNA polymerase ligase N-terminal domain-containing protein [Pirellulales bacterium]